MLKKLVVAVWRRMPSAVRRFTIRLTQARFAVSSGGIITDDLGRVLLLKHRFRPGSGWGMPGGFLKNGESPEEALQRELQEEVGLRLDEPKLFATRAFAEPKQIEIVFRCRALSDVGQFNFEIEEAGWFYLDELPEELPKDQARLIKSALAHGATPQD